jgi:hypothetical protein
VWYTRTRGLGSPGPQTVTRLSVASGWQDNEEIPGLGRVWTREQVAMGPNGTAALVVDSNLPTGAIADRGPTAMRFAPATSWSGPLVMADHPAEAVDLGVGPDGSALVVWAQPSGLGRWTMWASELSTGLQWGTLTPLHDTLPVSSQCSPDFPPGIGASPAVRLDSSGRAVAVWAEYDCVRWSVWANALRPR